MKFLRQVNVPSIIKVEMKKYRLSFGYEAWMTELDRVHWSGSSI